MVPPLPLYSVTGGTVENQLVILVVEDDQLLQSVVEGSLADGGFETVIASSGENAVELLDAAQGKYRALVTDINLSPSEIDVGSPGTELEFAL